MVVGFVWVRRAETLRRSVEHYAELAFQDDLTGIANDRSFRARLGQAQSTGETISLILVDIDRFKSYNDTFGHPAGDEALKAFGRRLLTNSWGDTGVFRVGGDEFALILPETDGPVAIEVAERLRAAIAAGVWPNRPITASLGVASIAPGTDLMHRADRALYRAKAMGGDRVESDQGDTEPTPG